MKAPAGSRVRPTSDKVKQALFNILGEKVADAFFLDLFAGAGGIGIEALSRGAASACFVEQDRAAMAALRENLRALALDDRALLQHSSVEAFLTRTPNRFGLILADPPYAIESYEPLLRHIAERGLLRPGGLLVIEHGARRQLPAAAGWNITTRRVFGDTAIGILEYPDHEENPA